MNLKELAKSKGTNIKKVAEKCNVPPTTLYAISDGKTNLGNVGIDTFMKVARALDMTAESLMAEIGTEVNYDVASFSDDDEKIVSGEEFELVKLYRRMQPEQKRLLMENARAFSALSEKDGPNDERFVIFGAMDAVTS